LLVSGCFISFTRAAFTFISTDCSITPDNVGANTYNTAIAIGEKAAVIIAEDLGIKGVLPA
jgi:hypothetical protein